MNRIAEIERTTKETSISIKLDLDGIGNIKIDYPIGFMSHMLTIFAGHGFFDLEIKAKGDLVVDQHHLVEDTGIVLGQCFSKALGEKRGINRVGSCYFPMDETLARAVVDICGRSHLIFEAPASINSQDFSIAPYFQGDTIYDFWQGFANNAGLTMHLDILRGRSPHHMIEAIFKAAGRALNEACKIDPVFSNAIPSTKGVLA